MANNIVTWDIEMSGCTAHVWGTGEQYVSASQLLDEKFILSIAWKYYGEEPLYCISLNKTEIKYKDDKRIIKAFLKVLEDADVSVYHNGDGFDLKEFNTRVIRHGLTPPMVAQSIDTWKACKKYFRFPSNKLDEVCKLLDLGQKHETGRQLWLDIVYKQDMAAMEKMANYNINDVLINEKLFTILLPHLRLNKRLFTEDLPAAGLEEQLKLEVCNNCGCTKGHKVSGSYVMTSGSVRYYYRCGSCKAHNKLSKVIKDVK
jgi:hypothetical protein